MVEIESIPMQQHLLRAVTFASSAISLHMSLTKCTKRRINTIIPVAKCDVLNDVAASLQFDIENRLAFRTQSDATIKLMIEAIEMLIHYDRMDIAANLVDMDRLQAEAMDTRIKNCMLLKCNLKSVLENV